MRKSNVQDTILNQCRKNNIEVTIFTNNGVPVKGQVEAFDDYTVLIRKENRQQNLVYKSALSTIIPSKPVELVYDKEDEMKASK